MSDKTFEKKRKFFSHILTTKVHNWCYIPAFWKAMLSLFFFLNMYLFIF